MKYRLDVFLHKKGFFESRERAKASIINGIVKVNGKIIDKPSFLCEEYVDITIDNTCDTYVSRGAYKLKKAVEIFGIDIENKIILDIGTSTGGFADFCLKRYASKVYCVDVGTNQLHSSLKSNSHIINYEKVDIRDFVLPEKVDVILVDVSFISLKHIVEKLKEFGTKSVIYIVLIKPQFECGKEIAHRYKGVPLDVDVHRNVLSETINMFDYNGLYLAGLTHSPIKGKEGNIEYLAIFKWFKANLNYNIEIEKNINVSFNT